MHSDLASPDRSKPKLRISRAVNLLLVLGLGVRVAGGTTYYVSGSEGADTAAGTSAAAAWQSLQRASQAALNPGDQVLFKAGDRFGGMLQVDARGKPREEILIGVYGAGDKPVIDGQGAEACIRLINPAYVTVQALELTNPDGLYGVRMTAQDAGALGTVVLTGLKIHNIYRLAWSKPAEAGHGEDKYYGGINAQVLRGERASWWEGIVIRDCEFHDLGTCGVSIGSGYPLHEKMRARRRQEPYPIKGVVLDQNVFRDVARDGAIIRQCDEAILQHNEVIRTGRVSISNGLWFWDCQNSVLRYNVGTECGVRGGSDGGPFSIDYYCRDCVIEYNYSHDNEGPAFMAFGNHRTSTGSIIRGNVSYNDATAKAKPGFGAVSMISTLSESVVEDNVIVAGPDTKVLMGHHDWEGMPTDVIYRGNVFVGNGTALVEPSVLSGGRFEGNLFLNVPQLPEGISIPGRDSAWLFIGSMQRREQAMAKAGRKEPALGVSPTHVQKSDNM